LPLLTVDGRLVGNCESEKVRNFFQSQFGFGSEWKHRTCEEVMALSSVYVEKAKVELGEDEKKREECLIAFRKFLKDHPFIKNSRNGEK
jgi:hypothetical protein